MAIAKTNFLNKISLNLIIGAFASLGISSVTKAATAVTPVVFTESTILSVDFNECKNRATKAANFLLKEVTTSEERNLRFKITGIADETVAVIYCIERSQGTIAIITTSTYSEQNRSQGASIYDRLTTFMTKS